MIPDYKPAGLGRVKSSPRRDGPAIDERQVIKLRSPAPDEERKSTTAYVISEIEPRDPALFERYRTLASVSIARYRGHYLVRGSASETIEGEPPAKMIVIVEFPSMERAGE